MRYWGGRVIALMLTFFSVSVLAAEEPGWERLTGAHLHAAFADMELGDGVHFAYRFHVDGHAEGTKMGKPMVGTWHTTAKQFCWQWTRPDGEEECHVIKRNGHSVHAYRNGREVGSGELTSLRK